MTSLIIPIKSAIGFLLKSVHSLQTFFHSLMQGKKPGVQFGKMVFDDREKLVFCDCRACLSRLGWQQVRQNVGLFPGLVREFLVVVVVADMPFRGKGSPFILSFLYVNPNA
ncbi:MAG: hypothetical protein ACOYD3_09510 [Kiritimatiellia bacterium]